MRCREALLQRLASPAAPPEPSAADRRRRVELEMRQVNPQVPDRVLYERERLHYKRPRVRVLGPSSPGNLSQLDRLLMRQVLGQRDVRMIAKRFLVFQRSYVQH